jgi:hypothetical protein
MSSNDSATNATSEAGRAQQQLIVALNPYVQRCLKRRQQRRLDVATGLSPTELRSALETIPQSEAMHVATVAVASSTRG